MNYGDGMKAKVRRMKEEVQRSGIRGQKLSLANFSALREFPVQTVIRKFNSIRAHNETVCVAVKRFNENACPAMLSRVSMAG